MDIEAVLDEVVETSTQPALGAIRLAWWREALERLDHSPPPPEPRLEAAARLLVPIGISGAMLAQLEDSRAARLEEIVDPLRIALGGQRLFELGAAMLGSSDDLLAAAGRLHALGRAARRRDRQGLPTEWLAGLKGHRFPRTLRPLTALARLAARDLRNNEVEAEATPGRAAALLSHWLFGTVA